jgi:integrase
MARRGAGEGTIRQRPNDGLWEARWRTPDGRRHSLYAKTRAEVSERLRAALVAADHGISPVRQQTTVGAWLDEWIATSVTGRLRPRTVESYSGTVRLYLKPALGKIPLARLQPDHVARMLRDLTARGDLSPTTVRYAGVILRNALGRALKTGKVLRNVATLVDLPRRARFQLEPLSRDEIRTFLQSIRGERFEPIYVLAIATGMRQGELLALRWTDVDLDSGTVTIRHTLELRTRALAEPKTENARRTLRIGTEALAVLRDHRRRQVAERLSAGPAWQDGDFVFTTSRGTALDSANVTRRFQASLDHAGLPRQRFHDLRHACATLLLEQGEGLGVVSKMLGHSTVSTTLDVYGHLTPAMTQLVADRMDLIIRQPASGG